MYENARLFFSILWLAACGLSLATGLAVLVSWGGYTDFFYASLALLAVSTAAVLVTSL